MGRFESLVTSQLLEILNQKARCWYCRDKTASIMKILKNRLPEADYTALSIEVNHIELGESADSFNELCKSLIAKQKSLKDL